MQDILLEVLRAIARFFMNPILYIATAMAIFIGYRRVKRERKQFHRRLLWGGSELKSFWREGLLLGALISVLSVAVGMTVPVQWLILLAIFMCIGILLTSFMFGSAIYAIIVAFLALWIIEWQQWSFTIGTYTFEHVNVFGGTIVGVTLFAAAFLIAEGMLIRRHSATRVSPILTKTKRGLRGIAYEAKQFWLLPTLFVIPGDTISAMFPYWPQFSLGHTQFELVLFPIVIGFQQFARQKLPQDVFPKLGKQVTLLGEIIMLIGLITVFFPQLGLLGIILALVGRLFITWRIARQQNGDTYAVIPKKEGVVIAGVLADSPAEKMGLVAGECIRKVNGQTVHTEEELYKALQVNAAYCKLEVLNHDNEVRLTQHAVFMEDHYRIGLLLV